MELAAYFKKDLIEVGCDEAGRGCLAGPVYAAAVILPKNFHHPLLNDSKLISKKNRELLKPIIEEEAIEWAVASVNEKEIDQINILNASFLAMHRAIDQLQSKIDLLLIDGNRFNPYLGITHHCIVKGDSKFASIAAASILAKTYRDEYMLDLDKKYPIYEWKKNQGYPTKNHREAIKNKGASEFHRLSFKLLSTSEQ